MQIESKSSAPAKRERLSPLSFLYLGNFLAFKKGLWYIKYSIARKKVMIMSSFLGFLPTVRPGYFFVSYNTEDAERITPIVTTLYREDVPFWYDHGIEYGEKWAPQINEKLSKSQGVLLFFTKGILSKENSYVRKEYKMAKMLGKKVYVIMVDEISQQDVPIRVLDWWIDITDEQCITAFGRRWNEDFYNEIKKALGVETHEKKMSMLMQNYLQLFSQGKLDEAEQYVSEYLRGKTLEEKAHFFAKVAAGKMAGVSIVPQHKTLGHPSCFNSWESQTTWDDVLAEKRNHVGKSVDPDCVRLLEIKDQLFTAADCFVFRTRDLGDAYVIHLWRNNELIFTVPHLFDACLKHMYYDATEDLLYLIYTSDKYTKAAGKYESTSYWSVAIIQDPAGEAIAMSFDRLLEEEPFHITHNI